MSEERLQEIKDSVDFQREILLAQNLGTLCVDEEQELIDEIERLNNDIKALFKENSNKEKVIIAQDNIIKEVREYIEKDTRWFDSGYAKTYGELCTCAGANDTRLEVLVNPSNLLEILDKENI